MERARRSVATCDRHGGRAAEALEWIRRNRVLDSHWQKPAWGMAVPAAEIHRPDHDPEAGQRRDGTRRRACEALVHRRRRDVGGDELAVAREQMPPGRGLEVRPA